MGRYKEVRVSHGKKNVIGKIVDTKPIKSYISDVCVIYESSSPVTSIQVADALNMAHELSQLSPKATKKQMQAIIDKHRISIS